MDAEAKKLLMHFARTVLVWYRLQSVFLIHQISMTITLMYIFGCIAFVEESLIVEESLMKSIFFFHH